MLTSITTDFAILQDNVSGCAEEVLPPYRRWDDQDETRSEQDNVSLDVVFLTDAGNEHLCVKHSTISHQEILTMAPLLRPALEIYYKTLGCTLKCVFLSVGTERLEL